MSLHVGFQVAALGEGLVTSLVGTDVRALAGVATIVDFEGARAQEGRPAGLAHIRPRKENGEPYLSLVCRRAWSFRWPRVVKRRAQPGTS